MLLHFIYRMPNDKKSKRSKKEKKGPEEKGARHHMIIPYARPPKKDKPRSSRIKTPLEDKSILSRTKDKYRLKHQNKPPCQQKHKTKRKHKRKLRRGPVPPRPSLGPPP